MPTGPRGERRPADAIGATVMGAKIARGEMVELPKPKSGRTRSGRAGANARKEKLSAERRAAVARQAAAKRWEK